MRHFAKSPADGFTLIECVVAMVVGLVGLLAVYTLIVTCIRIETIARDTAMANSFARAKIEQLTVENRIAGGSLTDSIPGYYDSPAPNFVRRWQVSNGLMAIQTVQVRVISESPGTLLPEVRIATRME